MRADNDNNGPWILAATILGSSMAFIDGTVVNVALPALQSALQATIADVQWVVESYALFLAALLLIGGSLGDLYGRRKIFVAGVVLFTAASAWCGLAPNIRQLIVARGLQGIGGALLVPGSLALISVNFSPAAARSRYRHVVWFHFDHRGHRSRAGRMVHSNTVRGDGCFSLIFRWGWLSLVLALWKVPESRAGKHRPATRLARRPVGRTRFRRHRLCSDRIGAGSRRSRRYRPDCAVVSGGTLTVADGSAPSVPFPQFQRRQPAHTLSLLRVERRSLLFSAQFDTGARLFGDAKRGPPCCLSFC